MKVKSTPGKIKAFALVRDGNGNPIFDDYFDIHPKIAHVLTDKDWKYIMNIRNSKSKNHEEVGL